MENKTVASDNSKIKLLELIRENRTVIFGAFSSSCTKAQKNQLWNDITTKAISLGLIPAHRDAKYVREVYWQNIRRRTVQKLDKSRATGAAGGSENILDDVDNMVIDIIGELIAHIICSLFFFILCTKYRQILLSLSQTIFKIRFFRQRFICIDRSRHRRIYWKLITRWRINSNLTAAKSNSIFEP